LIPVALKGFWQAWPPHRLLPSLRRSGLLVEFLVPVDPGVVADDDTAITLAMDRIYERTTVPPAGHVSGVARVL
jgi:hypothetical protein